MATRCLAILKSATFTTNLCLPAQTHTMRLTVEEQVPDLEVGPLERRHDSPWATTGQRERVAGNETLAEFIARETGITENQVRELIRLIGTDRNSLLREARQLLRQRLS